MSIQRHCPSCGYELQASHFVDKLEHDEDVSVADARRTWDDPRVIVLCCGCNVYLRAILFRNVTHLLDKSFRGIYTPLSRTRGLLRAGLVTRDELVEFLGVVKRSLYLPTEPRLASIKKALEVLLREWERDR